MLKQFLCKLEYILPQHLLTTGMGYLGNSRTAWVKNTFIDIFRYFYPIDLSEAVIEDAHAYPTFNAFFTRALKPGARPIDQTPGSMVSPADGTIAQFGTIQDQQLLQAKGMYFDLHTLLGGQSDTAGLFTDGHHATIYLAPHNYHRVHMPLAGTLRKSIYIPGNLFSVNVTTSEVIPNLYARNERLVLLFDTAAGPMAVIMVGAMIVGSMQTVWMDAPVRGSSIAVSTPEKDIRLKKGDDLGQFQMGSTVIVLMPKLDMQWSSQFLAGNEIKVGECAARLRQA